jgi:hypothetical protein
LQDLIYGGHFFMGGQRESKPGCLSLTTAPDHPVYAGLPVCRLIYRLDGRVKLLASACNADTKYWSTVNTSLFNKSRSYNDKPWKTFLERERRSAQTLSLQLQLSHRVIISNRIA